MSPVCRGGFGAFQESGFGKLEVDKKILAWSVGKSLLQLYDVVNGNIYIYILQYQQFFFFFYGIFRFDCCPSTVVHLQFKFRNCVGIRVSYVQTQWQTGDIRIQPGLITRLFQQRCG